MALQSSGPISISEITSHFSVPLAVPRRLGSTLNKLLGGTPNTSVSISDFYRYESLLYLVPDVTQDVSLPIDFTGTANANTFGLKTLKCGTQGFSAKFSISWKTYATNARIVDFNNGSTTNVAVHLQGDVTTNTNIVFVYNTSIRATFTFAGGFQLGTLYYIAIVFDPTLTTNGTAKLWVNGSAQTNIVMTSKSTTTPTLANSWVGRSPSGSPSDNLNAILFNLQVFNMVIPDKFAQSFVPISIINPATNVTALSATNRTNTSISLSWTVPSSYSYVQISWTPSNNPVWSNSLPTVNGATSIYSLTGLSANINYTLFVTAYNAQHIAATGALNVSTVTLPTLPTLEISEKTSSQFKVSYAHITTGTFILIVSTSSTGTSNSAGVVFTPSTLTNTAGTNNVIVSGLTANTRYYVKMIVTGTDGHPNGTTEVDTILSKSVTVPTVLVTFTSLTSITITYAQFIDTVTSPNYIPTASKLSLILSDTSGGANIASGFTYTLTNTASNTVLVSNNTSTFTLSSTYYVSIAFADTGYNSASTSEASVIFDFMYNPAYSLASGAVYPIPSTSTGVTARTGVSHEFAGTGSMTYTSQTLSPTTNGFTIIISFRFTGSSDITDECIFSAGTTTTLIGLNSILFSRTTNTPDSLTFRIFDSVISPGAILTTPTLTRGTRYTVAMRCNGNNIIENEPAYRMSLWFTTNSSLSGINPTLRTPTVSSAPADTQYTVRIGTNNANTGRFVGDIYYLKYYNSALTNAQITSTNINGSIPVSLAPSTNQFILQDIITGNYVSFDTGGGSVAGNASISNASILKISSDANTFGSDLGAQRIQQISDGIGGYLRHSLYVIRKNIFSNNYDFTWVFQTTATDNEYTIFNFFNSSNAPPTFYFLNYYSAGGVLRIDPAMVATASKWRVIGDTSAVSAIARSNVAVFAVSALNASPSITSTSVIFTTTTAMTIPANAACVALLNEVEQSTAVSAATASARAIAANTSVTFSGLSSNTSYNFRLRVKSLPTSQTVPTDYIIDKFDGANNSVTTLSVIQNWTVPVTGTYRLIAAGAAGGRGNNGALLGGRSPVIFTNVILTQNTVVAILVGQKGHDSTSTHGGGGGGATFITTYDNTQNNIYPAQMTSANTSTNTDIYTGNGASIGQSTGIAWNMFDRSTSTTWTTNAVYNTSTGIYTGTNNGFSLGLGEHAFVDLGNRYINPTAITLRCTTSPNNMPTSIRVCGYSRVSNEWSVQNTVTGLSWTANEIKTIPLTALLNARTSFLNATTSYSYIVFIVTAIGTSNTTGTAVIPEMTILSNNKYIPLLVSGGGGGGGSDLSLQGTGLDAITTLTGVGTLNVAESNPYGNGGDDLGSMASGFTFGVNDGSSMASPMVAGGTGGRIIPNGGFGGGGFGNTKSGGAGAGYYPGIAGSSSANGGGSYDTNGVSNAATLYTGTLPSSITTVSNSLNTGRGFVVIENGSSRVLII